MTSLAHFSEPDGLEPDVRAETAEIVNEPGYLDQVRQFRREVKDGAAFDGAVSTREELEKRLGLSP